jgi:hypothetical protein
MVNLSDVCLDHNSLHTLPSFLAGEPSPAADVGAVTLADQRPPCLLHRGPGASCDGPLPTDDAKAARNCRHAERRRTLPLGRTGAASLHCAACGDRLVCVAQACGRHVALLHRRTVALLHGRTVAPSHGCAGVGPKLVKVNVSFNAIAQVDGELLKALTQVGVPRQLPLLWRVALPRGGCTCHVAGCTCHVAGCTATWRLALPRRRSCDGRSSFVACWFRRDRHRVAPGEEPRLVAQSSDGHARAGPPRSLAMRRTPARRSTRPATRGPAFRVSWHSCGRMRQSWARTTQHSTARDAVGCARLAVCATVGSCGCLTNSRTSRRLPTRSSTKPVPTQASCRTTP